MAKAFRYKPPESRAADKRTPVIFREADKEGFIPGETEKGKELFFCMAEMYESSMKDYEALDTTNLQYAMTLIIPNPYPDYHPRNKHVFSVDDPLYSDINFNVEKIIPHGKHEIKIVGGTYG